MFSWICSKCGRTVWNCKTCKCGKIEKNYGFKVVEKGDKFKIVKNIDCEDKMTAEEREKIQKVLGLLEGAALVIKDNGVVGVLREAYDLLEGFVKKEGDIFQ